MITALLLFWPAAAALLVLLLKGNTAKKFAFGAAILEFLLALYAMLHVKNQHVQPFLHQNDTVAFDHAILF